MINMNNTSLMVRTAQKAVLDLRPQTTGADPLRAAFCWRLCTILAMCNRFI